MEAAEARLRSSAGLGLVAREGEPRRPLNQASRPSAFDLAGPWHSHVIPSTSPAPVVYRELPCFSPQRDSVQHGRPSYCHRLIKCQYIYERSWGLAIAVAGAFACLLPDVQYLKPDVVSGRP